MTSQIKTVLLLALLSAIIIGLGGIMGGRTGTNADGINGSRGGVPCGLVSIPQRNMHTPAEICDLEDMENTARLLAAFVEDLGKEWPL